MQIVKNITSLLTGIRNVQNSHIIEELLKSEELTIENLLDNDAELLQELRTRNKNLIKFFNSNVLSSLLNYLIVEPSVDDLKRGHKYPYVCNEIISCEIPEIIDLFFQEIKLLNQLFSFIDTEQINLTLSGYFANVVQILLKHNSYELLSYIYEQTDSGKKLPRHLYSTSILNLIYKILSCEDHGNPAYTSELYEVVDLILFNFQDSLGQESESSSSIMNITIINSASILSSLLLNHNEVFNWANIEFQVYDALNIQNLFEKTLSKNEVLAVSAINVLIAVLRNVETRKNEDSLNLDEILVVINPLCLYLPKYNSLLKKKSNCLGPIRLKIIELVIGLVKIPNPEITKSIIESNLLATFIRVFKRFPWNSILHNTLESFFTYIFVNGSIEIKSYLIEKSKLIDFLIKASKTRKGRVGYLGQVAKISNSIIKASCKVDNKKWNEFANGYLYEKNKLENVSLGFGNIEIKNNLELPKIDDDDVFYDALEGPDDLVFDRPNPQKQEIIETNNLSAEKDLGRKLDEYNLVEYWRVPINFELNDLI